MQIDRDMTFLYDLKVQDPSGKPNKLDILYNDADTTGTYGRLSPREKSIFKNFYDLIVA